MSNDNQDKPSAEAVNNQDSAGQGASEPKQVSAQNAVAPQRSEHSVVTEIALRSTMFHFLGLPLPMTSRYQARYSLVFVNRGIAN